MDGPASGGVRVGKRRVELAMRQNGLRGRGKQRFRICTTDSNHALPIAPNLLARNFTVAETNTVWAGDMTCIPTRESWLYLAVALELFSRRVVGWAMGEAITGELACGALDMAWYSRSRVEGLIFHSDRGSHTGIPGDRFWSLGWRMPVVAIRTSSPGLESKLP